VRPQALRGQEVVEARLHQVDFSSGNMLKRPITSDVDRPAWRGRGWVFSARAGESQESFHPSGEPPGVPSAGLTE
jgi:hypothetical protein